MTTTFWKSLILLPFKDRVKVKIAVLALAVGGHVQFVTSEPLAHKIAIPRTQPSQNGVFCDKSEGGSP